MLARLGRCGCGVFTLLWARVGGAAAMMRLRRDKQRLRLLGRLALF